MRRRPNTQARLPWERTAERSAVVPWQVFVSELVGTALLVLVGLSLVILMFGEGSPGQGGLAERRLAATDHRLSLRHNRRTDRAVPGREAERGAHQPGRHAGISLDGQARLADHARLRHGATVGCDSGGCCRCWHGARWAGAWRSAPRCREKAMPFETVLLGEVITTFAMVDRIVRVSRLSSDSSFHAGDVPVSVCRHGVRGVADLRNEHESRAQPGTGRRLGTMGGLVDLLGRPADRKHRRMPGVQSAREANHGREAVSLRQRPRQAVSQDEPANPTSR